MVRQVMPTTLNEALELLENENYVLFAGGTDLMVQNRSWSETPVAFKQSVMYLGMLSELDYIRKEEDYLAIGAMTSLETILHHPDTPEIMKAIISEMASPGIRNIATLAGNIGNASPAGDSLVGLYLLDGMLVLKNHHGERLIRIHDFILGPRKTALKGNELIAEIRIPHVVFSKTVFHKIGPRKADAISKLSFCGAYKLEQDIITDIRITFGAVYMTIVRNKELEQKMLCKTKQELLAMLDELVNDYDQLIQPIDDQRSSRIYRKQVALNLLQKFIREI